MKCLVRAAIVLLIASAFLGCGRKRLTPVAPWTDIVDDSLCFLAITTDPSGLGLEYTFDWGDGQTFVTRRYQSGETAYARHAFGGTAWRDVRVQARNENGKSSAWSSPLRFRKSNPPVVIDSICGLVRWAVNRWYRASVTVTDPDGDSVSVKFIWDGSEGGTRTELAPSGSTFTDSCLWSATGPHTVRVVVKDKGSMVTRPDLIKTVSVSAAAVIWTNDEIDVTTSPALGMAGGEVVVCVVSEPGVWAISADGTTRWKWESRPMSAHNGPSISADGSRLYVADDNKGAICFDVATGTILWQLAEQYGDCTPVVGPGGAIYVTSSHTLTRILDLGNTAAIGWEVDGLRQNTNVVIGENGIIYGVSYGSWEPCAAMVFALDSGGKLLWQDTSHVTDHYGGLMTCPALDSRGRLLVASGYDSLVCFSPDGSVAWSAEVPGLYGGAITVGYGDRVYVQSCDEPCFYCLDANGHREWWGITEAAGDLNNVCALADSSILIAGYGECVDCIDWDGQPQWKFSLWDSLAAGRRSRPRKLEGDDSPTPLVGPDGNIYVAYYEGLCCLSGENVRLANTAWPTYNHDNAHSGWAGRQ